MTITLNDYEEVEYKFSKRFVEFVNTFNLLDHNLALSISWFITGGIPSLAYPLVDKLSIHEKISYLKNVINDKRFENQKEMVKDFDNWCSLALKVKGQRNKYVHGTWNLIPALCPDKPIRFNSYNPNNMELYNLEDFESFRRIKELN